MQHYQVAFGAIESAKPHPDLAGRATGLKKLTSDVMKSRSDIERVLQFHEMKNGQAMTEILLKELLAATTKVPTYA